MPNSTKLDYAPAPSAALADPHRMRALRATELLRGHSDVLDRLARAAARLLGTPIAVVTLVEEGMLHIAGMTGLADELASIRRLPAEKSVCNLVVEHGAPLAITDILQHPIAASKPDVLSLGLRAYLGVPLTTRDGFTLGTFCVLDVTPHEWSDDDLRALQDLACGALSELELRITLHERRSNERRFRAFMDHSPLVAVLVDRHGTIEYVNGMFEWHFGLEPSKVIDKRLSDVDMPLTSFMLKRLDEVLREGRSVERTELLISPNGEERQWLLYSFPVAGDDEQRVGTVAVDLTDRRRLERQLQQSQRLEAIGQLAAGIAHEINTPAQYVSDNVRFVQESFESVRWLLQSDRPTCRGAAGGPTCELDQAIAERLPTDAAGFLADEVPRALEQSLEGLERIANIVRSIKEFSHPGGQERVLTDINHTLTLALQMARTEWKYVADCTTDFDSSLPLLNCYAGELNQALLNIVVNAAHAMRDSGRHGQLHVVTSLDGDCVRIDVSDTGNGIPENIRGRVFDPFFTTKAVGSGTGQGLAIAHSVIVEKHRGSIRFDTVEGKGTTFTIKLPLGDGDSLTLLADAVLEQAA